VHFLRNALDYLPRTVLRGVRGRHGPAGDDCLQELRWLYDRRGVAEARRDLSA
jgi:putative transposase